ncbi:spore coat protein CotS, partial [Mammaliicoccus sciuri]|uniref:CDP-glycerol glycerophosphotransferase family protein n=1 Tax=Mammaliicoccus sciuri TaxID=1296 RepID=UPI000D4139DE
MKNIEILSNAKNEKYDYYKKKYESTLKNNNNQRIIEKYNQYCNGDIKENCILYETFHGKSMTDNPYALFESLILDPEYKNYRHIWVINTLTSETEKYKNNENVNFVKVNSDEYLYYLAKAKYLINNTSFPPYFCKRKNQVYLNTWHGTPLKTLGIDMNGPIDQLKNIQRNFLQTDYLLSPNEFTTEKLVYSHNLDGIYTGEILEVGYPRIDLITKTNSKDILDKLRQYIEIDTNKKVALYAPTWRGNVGKEVDIKKEVKDIIVSIKNNLDSNYQLLLKVHPLLYKYFKNDKELSKIFIPDSIDISETLSIVDLLITDYSSVFFDFYVKNKPIILYTYDKAEYLSDRGTYLDFDELNTYVAENETELKDLIANVDILKGCKNESFISLQNGNVSKTVIDIVFKNNKNEKVKKVDNEKKNVLFYIDNLTDSSF